MIIQGKWIHVGRVRRITTLGKYQQRSALVSARFLIVFTSRFHRNGWNTHTETFRKVKLSSKYPVSFNIIVLWRMRTHIWVRGAVMIVWIYRGSSLSDESNQIFGECKQNARAHARRRVDQMRNQCQFSGVSFGMFDTFVCGRHTEKSNNRTNLNESESLTQ